MKTILFKGKYTDNEEYISKMTKIYNDLQYQIQNIQEEMKEFVDYVYNINDKKELKSMAVGRNKDNKQMKKDFDKWKKDAKDKVNKLKHGMLTEDEVYEWLVNNK